jgi:transposase InsO family protein
MEERIRFVKDCRSGLYDIKERCERYGISRKTGYKWLARFDAEGAAGLEERSRAPHHCEHRMSEPVRKAIVEARRRHPTWGPRKLRAWLERRQPHVSWPAVSSVGELLRREGLVSERRRQPRREPHPGRPQVEAQKPNDLWTVDFKGQFPTRSGWWCYPLTVLDHASRMCLALDGLSSTKGEGAQHVFERAFREFGLPIAILSDNGPPFVAPRGLCGLTHLSVWWLRLGIRRIRTEPASPEQNGAHERFHRTLKAETSQPPAGDRNAQQRRFNRFRTVYNDERPHEALDQAPPASRYRSSPRSFPRRLPEPEYPGHYRTRLLNQQGAFLFNGDAMHVSTALARQRIGMEEIEDGIWSIYFGNEHLTNFNERTRKIERYVSPMLPV